MSLPNTHIIQLRFKIDIYTPKIFIDRWLKLKSILEYYKDNNMQNFVRNWIQNCKLESIKNMSYLDRSEGGIGIDKHLRFRTDSENNKFKDCDIVINLYDIEKEKWMIEELDDLIRGFRICANEYVKEECINGFIEMRNKESYKENYLQKDIQK